MATNKTVGAYERKALEMLLRHELPEEFEVRIEITAKGDQKASAMFAFDGNVTKVKADLGALKSKRIMPPCW